MTDNLPAPDPSTLVAPILPALPPAAVAQEPAPGVLPLLSPILRQRVQLLSASSTEPWLRLLSYDTAKAAKLVELAQTGAFEPHPVSGEVEIDWDYDAQTRYRRLDEETLQALIAVEMLGLVFQLVYCVGDTAGGGDGWRIGEVTTMDRPDPFVKFEGSPTIAEAERRFKERSTAKASSQTNEFSAASASQSGALAPSHSAEEEEDDDDGYWDRYDATPAGRTPAHNRSPAPRSLAAAQAPTSQDASDEANYFAQYDDVQPAMDNHDPDEEAQLAEHAISPIGASARRMNGPSDANETHGSWTLADADGTESPPRDAHLNADLLHPRPESSASSNGEQTVAKLEQMADKRGENEFSIKQHVSRSIRSLWLLSRGSGIDREEFENMVKTELHLLGMVEDLA
ncbi:hypothetical protein NLU13_2130 [Sarocladium strictum]|uniref:Uncharacterized protein n=1 Tax=Sarocladium strictum TaxID=5046 RepID=A0AA39GS86_SARSR|nr:hypothetical protein NLU13_2130 [Sarocladium strictum]